MSLRPDGVWEKLCCVAVICLLVLYLNVCTTCPLSVIYRCKLQRYPFSLKDKNKKWFEAFKLDSFGHLAAPRNSNYDYLSERSKSTWGWFWLNTKETKLLLPGEKSSGIRWQKCGKDCRLHCMSCIFNCMQERPVYAEICKLSTLESISRDWKRCFYATRQLEHGRSLLLPWKRKRFSNPAV